MAIPVYSVKILEVHAPGSGPIPIPVDALNTRIVRDFNVFAGLGGTFNLRQSSGYTVLWCEVIPPDLFFFFDQKHIVIPAGEAWDVDAFPLGSADITIYGYSLSPP